MTNKTITKILGSRLFGFQSDIELADRALETVKKQQYQKGGGNTITVVDNLHENEELAGLHQWFHKCLDEVNQDVYGGFAFEGLRICTSWANCAQRGEKHQAHYHKNSLVSGIYYLTTEGHGNTIFTGLDLWHHNLFSVYNNLFERSEETPKKGKLVVFPSLVEHEVCPHRDDDPRYTIAFNAFPFGKMGGPYLKDYLEIK